MYLFIVMRNRRNLMQVVFGKAFVILFLVMLLAPFGKTAFAGGLVDTSAERFAHSDFTGSQFITNQWWTLTEGTNRLYFTETDEGCAWNLVEVLYDTTDQFSGIYAGTQARIVLDRSWVDENCEYVDFQGVYQNLPTEEATYDWYAQDTDNNIWYMGEDTYDSEGSNEGSFVAGCDGAEAGIVMLGDPRKGDRYQQEFYEGEAEDWGKVLNFVDINGMECLKTKEWSPLERGYIEHKYYCSDTGDLELIKELRAKTVTVELIGYNVPPVPLPLTEFPKPTPDCSE